MTTTLRESLARGIEDTAVPHLDVATLMGAGEARLRRRRFAAAAGSAVAAGVVVGAIALGAALNHPDHSSDRHPVDHPSPSPTETAAPPERKLLYSDVPSTYTHAWPRTRPGTIHFGERAIETGNAFVHLDVTDDGFVYTDAAGVQFSDGDSTVQIGSRLCVLGNGVGLHSAQDAVMTGAAGSLVAWFECVDPTSPTLVGYDTGSRREVVRQPMPSCARDVPTLPNGAGCDLDAVIGEHIYFNRISDVRSSSERGFSYDVTTGRRNPATARSYADDVRNNPRGLVVGDAWETATPEGVGKVESLVFRASGARLVVLAGEANGESPTTAFDTATHQAVRLRLPPGYRPPRGTRYSVFEWLDDSTIALTPGHNLSSADILTCRLSESRCRLAVKAGPAGVIRIMPATGLPG